MSNSEIVKEIGGTLRTIRALQRDIVRLEKRMSQLESLVANEAASARSGRPAPSGDFQTHVGDMNPGYSLSDEPMS